MKDDILEGLKKASKDSGVKNYGKLETPDIWGGLKKAAEVSDLNDVYAENNITGVTGATTRTASDPGGYYSELNEDNLIDLFSDGSEWEGIGAGTQGGLDLAKSTAVGFMYQVGAGIVDSMSSLDIKGMYDLASGNLDAHYGNKLHEWASSIAEAGESDNHIYGGDSMLSGAYWAKQIQGQGYTLGLAAENFAEIAGAAAIPYVGPTLVHGLAAYQGMRESYTNALSTGEEVEAQFVEAGYSREEARKKGNEAATLNFRMEFGPVAIMNMLQMVALKGVKIRSASNPFKTVSRAETGFSGAVETVLSKVVKNKKIPRLTDYAVQITSESLEEGYQTSAAKEAKYQVGLAANIVDTQSVEDRLFDDETRDSMIGGALGGGMFRFFGKRLSKLTQRPQDKRAEKNYDSFLKGVNERVSKGIEDLKVATASGDQDKIDVVRQRLQNENVMEALMLDFKNQKEDAFDTYVSSLQETLTAAEEGDKETLAVFGVDNGEGQLNVRKNFPGYIEDAKKLKSNFIKNYNELDDYESAMQVAYDENTFDVLLSYEARGVENIEKFKSTDSKYRKLSETGKKIFSLAIERTAISIAGLEGVEKRDSGEESKRYSAIDSRIKELSDSEDYSPEEAELDKNIFAVLDSSSQLKEELNLKELRKHQSTIAKRIKYIKNPQNKNKIALDRAKKTLDRVVSVKGLKDLRKSLQANNTLTQEMAEYLDDRIEGAEISQSSSDLRTEKADKKAKLRRYETTQPVPDDVVRQEAEEGLERESSGFEEKPQEYETTQPVPDDVVRQEAEEGSSGLGENIDNTIDDSNMSPKDKAVVNPKKGNEDKRKLVVAENIIGLVDNQNVVHTKKDKEEKPRPTNLDDIDVLPPNKDAINIDEIVDIDSQFAPLDLTDYDNEVLSGVKDGVRDFYEILEDDLGRVPTFEEFVKSFIRHSDRDSVDRVYNAIVKAWGDLDYTPVDYSNVYSKIFKDKKDIAKGLLAAAERMVSQVVPEKDAIVSSNEDRTITDSEEKKTPEEINEESINSAIEASSPIVELDEDGQPEIRDTDIFKTQVPDLKAAHLSIPYGAKVATDVNGQEFELLEDEGSTLNYNEYVNSQKLLDPDLFNEGEELTVKIPDDPDSITIQTWADDFTRGEKMTFGEWRNSSPTPVEEFTLVDGKRVLNPQWLDKVPLIAYDSEREPVFFIHDRDWYNGVNVGPDSDVKRQGRTIQEGRRRIDSLRHSITENGELKIRVTSKRSGTFQKTKEDFTLSEGNPGSVLATADDQGNLAINGVGALESEGRVVINTKVFKSGHTYEVRRAVNKDEYIALAVRRGTLDTEQAETVMWAIDTYLTQLDTSGKISTPENKKLALRKVQKETGLDITEAGDLEKFLNLYIPTVKGKFGTLSDVSNSIESNSNIKEKTPYIAMHNKSIVFGVKGRDMSEKSTVLYINPKKILDNNGAVQMSNMLKTLSPLVSNSTRHISKEGLVDNKAVVHVSKEGAVSMKSGYRKYLKDYLRTNIKSFNIGTQESPKYVTIVQPTINFEVVGQEEPTKPGESKKNKKEIEVSPTAEKVESTNLPVAEIEAYTDALQALFNFGAKESDIEVVELRKLLDAQPSKDDLLSPMDITDLEVDSLIRGITNDSGLSVVQNYQVVNFVFNYLSTNIGFKKGSTLDKTVALKDAKDSYFKSISTATSLSKNSIDKLESLLKVKSSPALESVLSKLKEDYKIVENIKENWNTIEDSAIVKLEKYTGITSVREVIENEESLEDGPSEVEKNYTKTSLEENGKNSASYRLKRFLSNIYKVDADGKRVTGFLGVETYIDFDEAYNTLGQVISSPSEVGSDFNLMVARLKENVDVHKWLPQVIKKLERADERIKNEFVYNFDRHTLSMKFVMMNKGREGHSLKVFDTNSTEITRTIRNQWESDFKQSPLVEVVYGKYAINKDVARKLLATFTSWSKVMTPTVRGQEISADGVPTEDVIAWLGDFGITMSVEAVDELKSKILSFATNDGEKKVKFNEMFVNSPNTYGIFGLLANYLTTIVNKEDTSFEDNPVNHPYSNINSILKKLATLEGRYSKYATTNSFRDGDKSIFGFTPTKYATDMVHALKHSEDTREELSKKSFNKQSYILKLLEESPQFREQFGIDHIGITAIKKMGTKEFGDKSISSLSSSDHELTKLGLFQDIEQGSVKSKLEGIDMRVARMFLLTMSDKSSMLALSTAVLDLKRRIL